MPKFLLSLFEEFRSPLLKENRLRSVRDLKKKVGKSFEVVADTDTEAVHTIGALGVSTHTVYDGAGESIWWLDTSNLTGPRSRAFYVLVTEAVEDDLTEPELALSPTA